MESFYDMNELPNDVIAHIFLFLDTQQVSTVSTVCKKWNFCTKQEILWKKQCQDRGFFADRPPKCFSLSWRETYFKHVQFYPRLVDYWKWNGSDRDGSIELSLEGDVAKRETGGHNPSIRGDCPLSGIQKYYLEVKVEKTGAWFSFGFASKEFDASAREHVGKGKGSCAYYSDNSTHRIFCPGFDDVMVPKLEDGDVIGLLLDLKEGSAAFFLNSKQVHKMSNPAWSNDPSVQPPSGDSITDVRYAKWVAKAITMNRNAPYEARKNYERIKLYPALSVGSAASARVIRQLSIPSMFHLKEENLKEEEEKVEEKISISSSVL